jgi:selenocysteine lyase/cysteine desulfurase
MNELEQYFQKFRSNIIGNEQSFLSPIGEKKIVYADWIASGRLYRPIEEKIINDLGPFIGNTHTETSITGTLMTRTYNESHEKIKKHVNAGPDDIIITAGFGMTTVVNKFQRILGLQIPEQLKDQIKVPQEKRPVVFLTHMEHHSNHTSWLETIAECIVIPPDKQGLVDYAKFEEIIKKYESREIKIGSFTAASNVTGIVPDYYRLAKIMHKYNGLCFIDFAAAAPYNKIDMHPEDIDARLDAIFFSPHKFLGGPGTSGVLVFDSKLYKKKIPDQPGGGTVYWTNPWGSRSYIHDIEVREDGGTPGFLQSIKTALCIELKDQMNVNKILNREKEMLNIAYNRISIIDRMYLLANNIHERLGVLSFYIEGIHYNLIVKLLNDYYGIQVRGGCSCAGTYGHYLMHVDPTRSKTITDKIDKGDLSEKPGWVRLSIHPTMTNEELDYIFDAIEDIIKHSDKYSKNYEYSKFTNEFTHQGGQDLNITKNWLTL